MEIDYKKIWIDGGYNKHNANYFNNSILAVKNRAKEKGLSDEVASIVIHEVMMECANGKKYPLDKCPCGCGIDKSGTAITHEMFRRIDEKAGKKKDEEAQEFQDRISALVKTYVDKKSNTVPKRLWKFLNKPIGGKPNGN